MNTIKGSTTGQSSKQGIFSSKACKRLFIFSIPILLSACVHWPEVATDCDAYGVTEDNQPMGSIVHLEPLFRDELDVLCADVKEATAKINPDARISGCAIPKEDGSVAAYYWVGDRCAMNHELCHAKHGTGHTERYMQDLERGVPMPYCPTNQLKLSSRAD